MGKRLAVRVLMTVIEHHWLACESEYGWADDDRHLRLAALEVVADLLQARGWPPGILDNWSTVDRLMAKRDG